MRSTEYPWHLKHEDTGICIMFATGKAQLLPHTKVWGFWLPVISCLCVTKTWKHIQEDRILPIGVHINTHTPLIFNLTLCCGIWCSSLGMCIKWEYELCAIMMLANRSYTSHVLATHEFFNAICNPTAHAPMRCMPEVKKYSNSLCFTQ